MNPLEARRRLLGRNVYKRTTEGNPAIAQGSLARMYPGITMQGWTEQASTTGKNLSYLEIGAYSATNTDKVDNDTRARIFEPLNPTGDIVISIATGFQIFCRKLLENTIVQESGWNAGPVKISKEDTFDAITVVVRKTDDSDWSSEDLSKTNFQIEYGTSATDYEPYTGGQPSPSPEYPQPITSAGKYNEEAQKYEYQVKLTGKNLWNAEEAAETSKWVASTSQNGYSDFAIDVIPGREITVSFPKKLPTGLGYYVGIVLEENGSIKQWMHHSVMENLIHQQATVTAVGEKIWIRCVTSVISDFVSENPLFQIEYGEERTEYEPYKEQTVTITSDRQLTKWDRLEKRNGQWGWVYKSEEIESYTDESVPGEYFSTTGRLSTGAQVWYETTTETFVPLTASEQEAMNALYTFRPTTVLSNDCGCNMTLTYKTKKSLEVAT